MIEIPRNGGNLTPSSVSLRCSPRSHQIAKGVPKRASVNNSAIVVRPKPVNVSMIRPTNSRFVMHNGCPQISNFLRHRVHRKNACKIHIQNYKATRPVRRSSPLPFNVFVKQRRRSQSRWLWISPSNHRFGGLAKVCVTNILPPFQRNRLVCFRKVHPKCRNVITATASQDVATLRSNEARPSTWAVTAARRQALRNDTFS